MKNIVSQYLRNGGKVVVGNIWHFTGLEMECTENMELRDIDMVCCEDHYESYAEAAQAVTDFADYKYENVEFL